MRISQREARRLRKRVAELESGIEKQRRVWGQEYIGGVQIASSKWAEDSPVPAQVKVARKLGHAVVVSGDDNQTLYFHALPLSKP